MRIDLYCAIVMMIVLSGCAKKPPDGLPPLVACTVRVMDGEKPMSEVGVSFQRLEGHGGWSINALTASDGAASAQTVAATFIGKGLPEGTYRLTLSERIELPPELIDDNDPTMSEKQRRYIDQRRKLPAIICDPSASPLELTVSGNRTETTIDISTYR